MVRPCVISTTCVKPGGVDRVDGLMKRMLVGSVSIVFPFPRAEKPSSRLSQPFFRISSRFLRSSLDDSFERCFEEPCFLFGQEAREVLGYSPGINGPGVPERRNPLFGDHSICT